MYFKNLSAPYYFKKHTHHSATGEKQHRVLFISWITGMAVYFSTFPVKCLFSSFVH